MTSSQDEQVPPPAAFSSTNGNSNGNGTGAAETAHTEDIYANVQKVSDHQVETALPASIAAPVASSSVVDEPDENIYQNAQDLAECIDDTGLRAVALYDYEAAADDEISFDPDDMITHIEQVSGNCYSSIARSGLIISSIV